MMARPETLEKQNKEKETNKKGPRRVGELTMASVAAEKVCRWKVSIDESGGEDVEQIPEGEGSLMILTQYCVLPFIW